MFVQTNKDFNIDIFALTENLNIIKYINILYEKVWQSLFRVNVNEIILILKSWSDRQSGHINVFTVAGFCNKHFERSTNIKI